MIDPMHQHATPVREYVDRLATIQGVPWHVVTIPEGSRAWLMGYRFASVSDDDLDSYLAGGAVLVPPRR